MNSLGVRSIAGLVVPGDVTDLLFFAGCLRAPPSALRPPSSALAVRYSHIPSRPPSRPNPDSRYPPNPAAASNRLVELIHTTPALIFGAMSSARLIDSL